MGGTNVVLVVYFMCCNMFSIVKSSLPFLDTTETKSQRYTSDLPEDAHQLIP